MRWGHRKTIALTMLCTGALVAAAPVHAAAQPGMSLSRQWVPPGGRVGVSLTGFRPGSRVDLFLDRRFLQTLRVGSSEEPAARIAVPAATIPGRHWVTARARFGAKSAQRAIRVSTPWSTFAGDLRRSGHNPTENVLDATTVGGLHRIWRTELGGVRDPVNAASSVAVVHGVLYTSTWNGYLYAMRASDGRIMWQTSVRDEAPNGVTVRGRAVYVTTWGGLGAFDIHTGRRLWWHDAVSVTPPAVTRRLVVVGDGLGTLRAYDRHTGEGRWRTDLHAQLRGCPALAGGIAYVTGENGVDAVSLADGTVRWHRSLGLDSYGEQIPALSTPVVGGATVFIAAGDGTMHAFDRATGVELWSRTIAETWTRPAIALTTPALADGVLYVGTANLPPYPDQGSSRMVALSAADGSVIWSHPVATRELLYSTPMVANGLVYEARQGGYLFALDTADGSLRWRSRRVGPLGSGPVVVDGRLYIGVDDLSVIALGLPEAPATAARPAVASLAVR